MAVLCRLSYRGGDRTTLPARRGRREDAVLPFRPSSGAGRQPVSPGRRRGISVPMATMTEVAEKPETRSVPQRGLDPRPRDVFTLGEPSRIPFQVQEILRSFASGFFDERDPTCSVPSTLTKIGGVVLAVTMVVLGLLGVIGALLLWAFHAAFG